MSTNSFPLDPSKRRVILILDEYAIETCGYTPNAGHIFNDNEAYVLPYPTCPQEDIPALHNIIDANLLHPDAMLIQSPYDTDIYENAENAAQKFGVAKHIYFSNLCMHLGAKEVNVEQITLKTHSGKVSCTVQGERMGVGVGGTIETEELEKLRSQMSYRDRFAGGIPNVKAAEALLRQTGLLGDANMRSLLDMRRSSSNQIIARKIELNISSEAKNNLRIAGRIGVPNTIKLSAECRRNIEEAHEYTLILEVIF